MLFNRKFIKLLLMSFIYLFSGLNAQQKDKISLSLNDALQLSKEGNYELKLAQAEVDKMQADKNKSLSAFLPQVTFSETFVKTDDPLNVFGLKLKQKIVSMADFNPLVLNNPNEFNNYTTKLEVMQPLINMDGFFGRDAAAEGLSALNFKKQRTENYIHFMVKTTYYQLVLTMKSLDVINKALNTAEANRKLIKDYYDEGMITKADYLRGEVYVANIKSQKVEIENALQKINDNLRVMLGMEKNVEIQPTDTLSLPQVSDTNFDIKSLIENRSDIQAYSHKVSSFESMKLMNKMKFLPRLNAFGIYEYNDDKIFGSNAKNWMIGLNLQWNIFNGFQNVATIQKSAAELDQAEIEYRKALMQGQNEINEAFRDLETARTKVNLAKTSADQSDESLKITRDRYEKGLEKTTDLVNSQTAASEAHLKYLQAVYFYNVSVFKIEFMIEKNFERK
ncbi:MAG TPA: TolC family protein [Ignavibacteriaceae bacterium]|nr:TolC family protein [Ignavibacteriaceae bacterium]